MGVCDFGPSAILVRFWSAAAWAAGLPPGEARAWAAANVVGQWRLFNESAAQAWIKTLPPDERAIAVKAMPELQTAP